MAHLRFRPIYLGVLERFPRSLIPSKIAVFLFVWYYLIIYFFSQIKQLFEKNIYPEKVALEGRGFRPMFSVKGP